MISDPRPVRHRVPHAAKLVGFDPIGQRVMMSGSWHIGACAVGLLGALRGLAVGGGRPRGTRAGGVPAKGVGWRGDGRGREFG
jgi:hypothetical protein